MVQTKKKWSNSLKWEKQKKIHFNIYYIVDCKSICIFDVLSYVSSWVFFSRCLSLLWWTRRATPLPLIGPSEPTFCCCFSLSRARHRISFESLKFIPTVVYEYCHALWKCEISNKIKRHQPREMHEPWVPDIKWARMEKNTHNCTIVYVTMRERHK